LAQAEYRLGLWRIRGERPDDAARVPPDVKRLFEADSVPQAESVCPSDKLRAVVDRVHQQVLRELPGLDATELGGPVPHPHPFETTKLRPLLWCAHHEILHAGQIGMLRRHPGDPSMW
jgi:hypothetical protein